MNTTRYMTPQDGIEREIHIWKADGKWYSCYSGTYRGIYSESDDFGPFDTKSEASEFAVDAITEHVTG